MTVRELINELLKYDMDENVKAADGAGATLLDVVGTEQLYYSTALRDGVLLDIEEAN